MRTHEVVALDAAASGVNTPGEFVMVAVDEAGALHQKSGNDPAAVEILLELMKEPAVDPAS